MLRNCCRCHQLERKQGSSYCPDCDKLRLKQYKEKNKVSLKAKNHEYYLNNKSKYNKPGQPYYYKSSYKISCKKWRDKIRSEVLCLLGNKCVRCGFSDIRALQIDHIYGCGNKERNSQRTSNQLKKGILSHPEKYQLLCANCNWIKRHENGENRK